jgi:hypothetical protein
MKLQIYLDESVPLTLIQQPSPYLTDMAHYLSVFIIWRSDGGIVADLVSAFVKRGFLRICNC